MLHDRNPQFVTLSDGSIRNGYTVKLLNMIPRAADDHRCRSKGCRGATMSVVGVDQPEDRVLRDLASSRTGCTSLKVFVRLPRDAVEGGNASFRFIVEDTASYETDDYVATFNVPERRK